MKIKKLCHVLTHIAQLYPEADVKFEGTEHIFSTDKDNGEVEWSHRNIKSIEFGGKLFNVLTQSPRTIFPSPKFSMSNIL